MLEGSSTIVRPIESRREYGRLLRSENPERTYQQLESRDEIPYKGGRAVTAQILTLFKIFAKQNFLPYFKFLVAFLMPSLVLKPRPGLRMFGFGLRDFKPMI